MNVSVTFTGGQEMAKALASLPAALSLKAQRVALRAGAEPMREEAAALAPRGPDAPHIAANIVVGIPTGQLEDVREEDAVVAVGPSKDYFYGFFWEFGWIHHAAHPFMRPAFDTKAPVSLTLIGEQLWKSIDAARGKLVSQQASAAGSSRARSSGVGL